MVQAHQSETLSGDRGASPDAARSRENALLRSQLRSTPGFYRLAWGRFKRNKVAVVALAITLFIVIFSLSAGLVSEYITGHDYARNNLRNRLAGPFTDNHALGTDPNGRDLLTRIAYGGRVSLRVAFLAAAATLTIGCTAGAVAGYFGGKIDSILMRLVDVLICLPGLAILLLISTIFTPGPDGLALIIASYGWTGIARLVRGEVLSLRNRDYIEAARVVGAPDRRIIFRHIFPNVMPIVIVWTSLALPGLILAEAALSFLGFGVPIPIPSWGNMLDEGAGHYAQSWWNVFLPGFMIYITVLAINLAGIGLRDAFDPRITD
ncbi:MAG: ABC transporter permease [Thermomicrobiales bacterium]